MLEMFDSDISGDRYVSAVTAHNENKGRVPNESIFNEAFI